MKTTEQSGEYSHAGHSVSPLKNPGQRLAPHPCSYVYQVTLDKNKESGRALLVKDLCPTNGKFCLVLHSHFNNIIYIFNSQFSSHVEQSFGILF